VVDLKLGVQAIEYFQLQHGQWALLYSSFHLEENYGIKNKEEEIDGLDIHEHGTNAMTNP
jgi:Amt family ammonium transporter